MKQTSWPFGAFSSSSRMPVAGATCQRGAYELSASLSRARAPSGGGAASLGALSIGPAIAPSRSPEAADVARCRYRARVRSRRR